MKRALFLGLFSVLMSTAVLAQTKEVTAVKAAIEGFSKAGDASDADKLATYLDVNYRVVMNQLFGGTEVAVMPRAVYLDKIRKKEFGGDKRELTFNDVQINGNTAYANVVFKGTKMTFTSIVTLAQNAAGSWLLVSDVPVITK